jgi:replication factor A1
MSFSLSHGALATAARQPTSSAHPKPIFVQVTDVKTVPPGASGGGADRVKCTICDGESKHLAILSRQANTQQELRFAVLKVNEYTLAASHQVPVFILIDVEIVASEHGELFPNATPAPTPGGAPQQGTAMQQPQQVPMQQQQQQNYGQQPQGAFAQQAPAAAGGQPTNFHPIASLNPYNNRWTIRARVMKKGDLRTFTSKATGTPGSLFSVDLCDDSGEIRATMFTEMVAIWEPKIQEGDVYIISRGQVKPANKRFNHLNNDYELTLDQNTVIQKAADDGAVPMIKYSFVDISDLKNAQKDDIVDICAIVTSTGQVGSITTRAGKELSKRAVTVVDTSNTQVELTLWGEVAESPGWGEGDHPTLCVKGCRVGHFRGVSLSTTFNSNMAVNSDHAQAARVRAWFDAQGGQLANVQTLSESGVGSDGSGGDWEAPVKTLGEVKDSTFGMEKPMAFSAIARIALIKHDATQTKQPWYDACPGPDCRKGVQEAGPGTYFCAKCGQNYTEKKETYILGFVANDHTGSMWLTAFGDLGETLMGVPAPQLATYQQGNPAQYDAVFKAATFKLYNFKVTARQEEYQGEYRMKYSVRSATPVSFAAESKKRLEQIRALSAQA